MLLIQRTGYQPSQQYLLVKLIIDANRQIIMISVPVGLIIIITLISPAVSAEHASEPTGIFPPGEAADNGCQAWYDYLAPSTERFGSGMSPVPARQ
ncbi:Uncharacterised protein [Salmonella enterica subsp. enterica]|uniref:Uncharacterized protein n=1 Tax=Salmonella enterica I TaxID=59201 RepID=A0A379WZ64_SALET|nr:Uncharacterised protein [Salmonella enterica subsp. enterica]